mmetsp:Transcript_35220/g.56642  ORF Transcript_35220/g.56642 Transcript_35220/m.56642 type:complete len:83 (+) Transcript_35220:1122-1370(+)
MALKLKIQCDLRRSAFVSLKFSFQPFSFVGPRQRPAEGTSLRIMSVSDQLQFFLLLLLLLLLLSLLLFWSHAGAVDSCCSRF